MANRQSLPFAIFNKEYPFLPERPFFPSLSLSLSLSKERKKKKKETRQTPTLSSHRITMARARAFSSDELFMLFGDSRRAKDACDRYMYSICSKTSLSTWRVLRLDAISWSRAHRTQENGISREYIF